MLSQKPILLKLKYLIVMYVGFKFRAIEEMYIHRKSNIHYQITH